MCQFAGGGPMISFTWLSSFRLDDKTSEHDLPKQWNEITGYRDPNLIQK